MWVVLGVPALLAGYTLADALTGSTGLGTQLAPSGRWPAMSARDWLAADRGWIVVGSGLAVVGAGMLWASAARDPATVGRGDRDGSCRDGPRAGGRAR